MTNRPDVGTIETDGTTQDIVRKLIEANADGLEKLAREDVTSGSKQD